MRFFKWSPCIIVSVCAFSTLILFLFDVSFLRHGAPVNGGTALVAGGAAAPSKLPANAPTFAFWIAGTGGEKEKILRLLKAVYHPRNRYLLHLDGGSSDSERTMLALSVRSEGIYRSFDNVDVVGKGYAVDQMGASAVSATLHGAAVLLRISPDWDWFINLSASDYPLLTQDELLRVFADLPRGLNFIHHTSNSFGQEHKSFEEIVVDQNLHLTASSRVVFGPKDRAMPDAFKIFTGYTRFILSRSFMEHCIFGPDNLPRKLLLYFSNVVNPMESYFHTVICNSPEYINTTINTSDLGRLLWGTSPSPDAVRLKQPTNMRETNNSGVTSAKPSMERENIASYFSEHLAIQSKQGCL